MKVLGRSAFYDRSKDLVPSCQKAINAAEFWANQIKIPLFRPTPDLTYADLTVSLSADLKPTYAVQSYSYGQKSC